jgi:hypothetical protein
MGTIKTTNIEPIADNGTVTLGSSGDTFTIPSGATLDLSNATQTGVGGVNTPAFMATLSSNQSVGSNGVNTKVAANSELFDTDSAYDNATYRFTPQVAGKYFVFGQVMCNGQTVSDLSIASSIIYRNTSVYKYAMVDFRNNPAQIVSPTVNAIVNLNGSSDYVEFFGNVYVEDGAGMRFNATYTYWGAYKIIE